MVRTRADHIILWPAYFDSRRARADGRRVPKSLGVERPSAEEILKSVKALGLNASIHQGKAHPSSWWESDGCVSVEKTLSKAELIGKVAPKLKEIRIQNPVKSRD